MRSSVREWLPWGVLSQDAVRETLEQAVVQWNGQWFATPGVVVAEVRPAMTDARAEGEGTGWRLYRTAVAVRAARGALSRLAGRALDLRPDTAGQTAADLRLLAAFEEKLVESLVETLERALGVGGALKRMPEKTVDPIAGEGGVLVSLTDPSGRETLSLAIPSEVVFRHIKAALPRQAAKGAPLQSLAGALADVRLPLEAQVGKVELTLAELNELAIGDVLVLDRRVDEAIDIAGVHSQEIFARAVLTQVEDGLALKFNE